MKEFSKNWKSSKKPKKQRKYLANAPLHIRRKFLSAHLSKELRTKYKKRSFPVRKEDKVTVLRGQFKKTKGKIVSVNLKKSRVHIDSVQLIKKDGSKVFYPIHPSNLMITDLNLEDNERIKALARSNKDVTSEKNKSS
ncbi:50S ribosomal protein L24 [Candidatus Woesearchaeota archaeon]|nr:50S ribosomal protein L24 [Candidatus Woesearchaeota archaeon]